MRSNSGLVASVTARCSGVTHGWVVAVFLPLVWLTIELDMPVMASTFASTVAVACAAPVQFRQVWAKVARAYLAAIGISAGIAYPLAAIGCPDVVWASVAAGVIALSAAGRLHAPTACVPFALVGAPALSGLTTQFVVLCGGVTWTMVVLLSLTPTSMRPAPAER